MVGRYGIRIREPVFGEPTHRGRFVYRNSDQASVKKDALQVSGSVTDLESPSPFDEGGYFQDPVFPMTK